MVLTLSAVILVESVWPVILQKLKGINVAATFAFLAVLKYNEKLRTAATKSSRDADKLIFT